MHKSRIKVLVVDDSAVMRKSISRILESDPRIEVVGVARNGQEALARRESLQPDIMTMDIEMPVMDGLTALRKIMSTAPLPVIMISSLTVEGAQATMDALAIGAVDFIPKDFEVFALASESVANGLCEKIRMLAESHVSRTAGGEAAGLAARLDVSELHDVELVLIGSSTGGPKALQSVLTNLPGTFPAPIMIVQHMPAQFSLALAHRLHRMTALQVEEGVDEGILEPGKVTLAPGGFQSRIMQDLGRLRLKVESGGAAAVYKPSIDITASSLAACKGVRTLAIMLTGMGRDGCDGFSKLKASGGAIVNQSEASALIYGMPRAVAEAGLSHAALDIEEIHNLLFEFAKLKSTARLPDMPM